MIGYDELHALLQDGAWPDILVSPEDGGDPGRWWRDRGVDPKGVDRFVQEMAKEDVASLPFQLFQAIAPNAARSAFIATAYHLGMIVGTLLAEKQRESGDVGDLRDRLAAAEARNRDHEAVLAGIYRCGVLYGTQRVVARICDEELDTSGALLGRVRDLAVGRETENASS